MESSLSIEEIKKLYPDEWVLIANPVKQENSINLASGVPIYHSKDKREVCYLGREKKAGYSLFTLYYTGTFKRTRIIATVFSNTRLNMPKK